MDVWKHTRDKLANFHNQPDSMDEQTHNPNPPQLEMTSSAMKKKEEEEAIQKVEEMLRTKQERRRII